MPHRPLDDEVRYRLLKLLEDNPELSQREFASALGISLGKFNHCVCALIERGWVRVGNFGRSGNKIAYFYRLTLNGATGLLAPGCRARRLRNSARPLDCPFGSACA